MRTGGALNQPYEIAAENVAPLRRVAARIHNNKQARKTDGAKWAHSALQQGASGGG